MFVPTAIASVSALPVAIFWGLYHLKDYHGYEFPINLTSIIIATALMFGIVLILYLLGKLFKVGIATDAMMYATPTVMFSIVPFYLAQEITDILLLGLSLGFSLGFVITCAMGVAYTIANKDFPFWKTSFHFTLAGYFTGLSVLIILSDWTRTPLAVPIETIGLEVISFVLPVLFMIATMLSSIKKDDVKKLKSAEHPVESQIGNEK